MNIVKKKAFRYWNDKTGRFEIDGGEYDILIGASVADIRLSGTVTVQGTNAPRCEDPAKLPHFFSGEIKNVPDGEFETLLGRPIPDGSWSGRIEANDAIGKMAGGMVGQEMCEGILDIVNGHGIAFCKGLGKLIGGFFKQLGVAKRQKALE